VAAVIPATSGFLHDSRAEIGSGRLLYELGVSIVLLMAIPEEFAFRGVLLGSAMRLWGPWRASLITSALFGLWHIEPTLHTMRDNHAVAGAAVGIREGPSQAYVEEADVLDEQALEWLPVGIGQGCCDDCHFASPPTWIGFAGTAPPVSMTGQVPSPQAGWHGVDVEAASQPRRAGPTRCAS
jgi:membrane protease YdiL (CAAX protease family)